MRGGVGSKTPVFGVRDRETGAVVAAAVKSANRQTAERMIDATVGEGAAVYTDTSRIYGRLENHEAVNRSKGEYVRDDVHINGIESFWALLKRGYTAPTTG